MCRVQRSLKHLWDKRPVPHAKCLQSVRSALEQKSNCPLSDKPRGPCVIHDVVGLGLLFYSKSYKWEPNNACQESLHDHSFHPKTFLLKSAGRQRKKLKMIIARRNAPCDSADVAQVGQNESRLHVRFMKLAFAVYPHRVQRA